MYIEKSFFKNVIDLNKLLFQYMGKPNQCDSYDVSNIQILYNQFENKYYKECLYPQLKDIWKVEKESFMVCVACIMFQLLSIG
jgi:hypothetical protein